MKIVHRIIAVFVVVLLAGAAGCAAKPDRAPAGRTYTSAEGGYSLPVPAGWKVKPQGGGLIIFQDQRGVDAGGLDILSRKPGPDPEWLPNHSRELDRRGISTPAGPGRVLTLERSLPAASGDPRVWREQHAFIPVGDRVYDLWVMIGHQDSGDPVPPLRVMLAGFVLTKAASGDPGAAAEGSSAPALGKLAFVRDGDIWVKPLPDGKAVRLTRDGRNTSPRWSPSGRWLAFEKVFYEEVDAGSGRKLRTVKASELWAMRDSGAGAQRVAPGSSACQSWSPTADTLAYSDGEGIWTVTATVDLQKPRKVLAEGGLACRPWSPDGRWLAYVTRRGKDGPGGPPRGYDVLAVLAADGGERRELLNTAVTANGPAIVPWGWSADGRHVLYRLTPISASLSADGSRLEAIPAQGGKAVTLSESVLGYPDFLAGSPKGDVLAMIDGGGRESWTGKRLVLADPATGATKGELTGGGEAAASPGWSPDGRRLAYVAGPDPGPVGGGQPSFEALARRRVWVADLQTGKRRRLTEDEDFREERPLWSTDGSHILFIRVNRDDQASLWLAPVSGGSPVQVAELPWNPSADASERWWGYYGHVSWDALFDFKFLPATPTAVEYQNARYGFKVLLPESWRGYSVVVERWLGEAIGTPGDVPVEQGPMILLRHPRWTAQNPRQDIPIMVFSLEQWHALHQEKFHIGAAPVGPSELGRNSSYVFALPARYNYAFQPGWEEVEQILQGHPLRTFAPAED